MSNIPTNVNCVLLEEKLILEMDNGTKLKISGVIQLLYDGEDSRDFVRKGDILVEHLDDGSYSFYVKGKGDAEIIFFDKDKDSEAIKYLTEIYKEFLEEVNNG